MKIEYALIMTAIIVSLGIGVGLGYQAGQHPSEVIKMGIYHEAFEDMNTKYWVFSKHHVAISDSLNRLYIEGKKMGDLYDLGYWRGKADGIGDGMNTIIDRMRVIDNTIINPRP